MEDVKVLFGIRLREIRKLRSLTQEELAELSGVHNTYVSDIERCEANITLDVVQRIANALSVPVSHMFEFGSVVDDGGSERSQLIKKLEAKLSTLSSPELRKTLNILNEIFNSTVN